MAMIAMKYNQNIMPAGYESDDEYDEFGDIIEKKTVNFTSEIEDFQLTLEIACQRNDVSEIKRALNSGSVNINSYLREEWTALMYAAFHGSLDAINYLLQNGADPLVQFDCHNVIMCVCNCKSISNEINLLNCLELLANYDNIDINAKDRSGLSALMYACSNGWLKLVEFLIARGADIEMKDNNQGETALFFAVRSNSVNVVKYLLTQGADKNATDYKNQTVHRIAETKNMVDILKLLNIDNNNELLDVPHLNQNTYWDLVMTELENGFKRDVYSFLEQLSMEIYAPQINVKNITFKRLLSGTKDQFVDFGINLSPHCKLLDTALKSFHKYSWSNRSLFVERNEINPEKIAQILATIVRQLHVIDGSIMYLGNHSYGLNQQKGEEALNYLMNIRRTENKIFEILDRKSRKGQVDYIGPRKLTNRQNYINLMDKVFAATAVILVVLRII